MRIISFLYFFLLTYIIAALVFWGISLNKQNEVIFSNEIDALHVRVDSVAKPEAYKKAYTQIKERENTRKRQYLGEGATFLAIILIGAGGCIFFDTEQPPVVAAANQFYPVGNA